MVLECAALPSRVVGQPPGGVLAQELVDLEAAQPGPAHQRLPDEIGERPEVRAGHRRGGFAGEAAAEDREPPEDIALLVGEQAPRVVEHRSHASMSLGDVAGSGREEVEAALDLVGDLRRGEQRRPGGRDLDPQRHALDEPTDPGDLRSHVVGQGEGGIGLAGPLDEQPDGAVTPAAVPRDVQPVDIEDPFALDAEALARGGQHRDPGCLLDDLGQELRALDEVLEVVEDEERRPPVQEVQELLSGGEAAERHVDLELERCGHRRGQEVGRSHRDERNEVDPVLVAIEPARGRLDGESRLAHAARSDEGQEAAGRVVEEAVDRGQLVGPADERRPRGRQVGAAGLERPQRRELGRQPVDLELEDPLRGAEVPEPVRPEVTGVAPRRAPGWPATGGPGRRGRRRRCARPGGRRPRRSRRRSPAARRCGCPIRTLTGPPASARWASTAARDRVGRPGEGDEEGVALGVDLDAAVGGDGPADGSGGARPGRPRRRRRARAAASSNPRCR